jgi:hypothetical protein
MTAEIIVLNREGIAMAADSAVTSSVGNIDKISSSANKLFSLSDHYPVGIMIYGNSSFMGIPWETIIKVFRSRSLPRAGFPTIDEYAKHFIAFLNYQNIQFSPHAEEDYIQDFVSYTLGTITDGIFEDLEKMSEEDREIDNNRLLRLTNGMIDGAYDYFLNLETEYIPKDHSKLVIKKYNAEIQNIIKEVFNGLPVSDKYRSKLKRLLVEALSKNIPDNISSGVVIAGFGEKEFTPMIKAFNIEGIVRIKQTNGEIEILKYMENQDGSTTSDTISAVMPYAQREMVCRFMDGVDPDYLIGQEEFMAYLCKDFATKIVSKLSKYNDVEKKTILQSLVRYGKSMTRQFSNQMNDFMKEVFADPTLEAVGRLTKNELASMAEALVYITSLKRKVSSESETVAEPIDVALITKGDGFVWIKRKLYFDPKLNPVYFMNRNKEIVYGQNENTETPNLPA